MKVHTEPSFCGSGQRPQVSTQQLEHETNIYNFLAFSEIRVSSIQMKKTEDKLCKRTL